jgi:putative nucleotidyltransferase with HDIG domain
LVALAKATDMRDPYVMEHSLNVARYAELIAKELGLPAEKTELVRKAGLLHDIGKLAIPDAILFKPEKLTGEEYIQIKDHVITGADLIYGCHSLRPLIPIIKHHHESYDGSGYPDGLAGEIIPLEARILGVSDALEAMASDRPYRKGRTPQGIVEELKKWSGKQFDPMVVDAFIRVVQKHGESVIVNSARSVQARQASVDPVEIDAKQSSRQVENNSFYMPVLASG